MARRRKRRSSHRRAKMSNAPRRRHHRRSYHRNPVGSGMWKDLMAAVIAGGAGYLIAQKGSDLAEQYMPGMIPRHDIMAPALAAAAIVALSEKYVKSASTRAAVQAAGALPLVTALVNAAGLGQMLGTAKAIAVAPAAASPALSAQLMAQLEDSYSSDY